MWGGARVGSSTARLRASRPLVTVHCDFSASSVPSRGREPSRAPPPAAGAAGIALLHAAGFPVVFLRAWRQVLRSGQNLPTAGRNRPAMRKKDRGSGSVSDLGVFAVLAVQPNGVRAVQLRKRESVRFARGPVRRKRPHELGWHLRNASTSVSLLQLFHCACVLTGASRVVKAGAISHQHYKDRRLATPCFCMQKTHVKLNHVMKEPDPVIPARRRNTCECASVAWQAERRKRVLN